MMRCGLVFLVVATVLLAIVNADAGVFSAKNFFLGDWELEIDHTDASQQYAPGYITTARWNVLDGNTTLYGTVTDEKDQKRKLIIEFDEDYTNHGQFLLSAPINEDGEDDQDDEDDSEDEDLDFALLFAFAFENRTAGFYHSQGPWQDARTGQSGVYQLVAVSPSTMVLTVWLSAGEQQQQQMMTITGRKPVEKPASSPFSSYGMPLAVMAMMIISQVLKARAAGAQQPQQAQRRPAAQAQAQAQAQEEEDDEGDDGEQEEEPRFTEITDDDKKDQ